MPGKNRAKLPPPGQSKNDDVPPPVPARRAPPPIPQPRTQTNSVEEDDDEEESYVEPSTAISHTPETQISQDIYDDFEEGFEDDPPPSPGPPPPPPARGQRRPIPPVQEPSQDLYDEFEEDEPDNPPAPVSRPPPPTRAHKLPDIPVPQGHLRQSMGYVPRLPTASLPSEPEEHYDEFEVESAKPAEEPQDMYDDFGIDDEQVYEPCEENTSAAPSPKPPPLPSMENRGNRALPPTPKAPPLPPIPTPNHSEAQEDIYEETDDDRPPPPPPSTNRPPISPHTHKTPEKNAAIGGKQLGIAEGAIQGALKNLRKVSQDKSVEEKNEKNKTNHLISDARSRLRKNSDNQDSGVIVVTPTKENNRPLPTPQEKPNPAERELPIKVLKPPLAKKPPPPAPAPALAPVKVSPPVRTQSPPQPPSPDLPPPPSPIEDFESEEIYDDASSIEDQLMKFEWYRGNISRDDGCKLVEKVGKDGAFLVRTSKHKDVQPYTLVVLYKGRVNNLKVRLRKDGKYALGEAKENEITFLNIQGMVNHHKVHPVLLMSAQKGEITLQVSPRK